jgi:chromosome partitioning protein
MAKVIANANQKGGVGKTTTTVNLAHALVQKGQRVLCIDADPQANLTTYLSFDPDQLEEEERTLYFSLVKDKPISAVTVPGNPALVPASIVLADAEIELAARLLKLPYLVLRRRLEEVREQYDFILIDCMPSLGMLTANALAAADYVLIPSATEYLSSKGIRLLLTKTIAEVRDGINPQLQVLGVLPTLYDRRTNDDKLMLESLTRGLTDMNVRVFEPILALSAFNKASMEKVSTVLRDPDSPGAQAYYQLAEEVIQYAK